MSDWTPTGVGDFNLSKQDRINSELSNDTIALIATTLNRFNMSCNSGTVKKLQEIVSIYAWGEAVKESTKPSAIRRDIYKSITLSKIDLTQSKSQIVNSFCAFSDSINSLNMGARVLMKTLNIYKHLNSIAEHLGSDEPNKRGIRVMLNKCTRILERGLKSASELPMKGRLPELRKLTLCADIADLLRQLGREPVADDCGCFHEIVVIILTDVHEKEFLNVHSLLEAALSKGSPTNNLF